MKTMSKKVKIFGKQISVVPIAVVLALMAMVGLASAGLVGYISNKVTATVEVESPMVAGISLGKTTWAGERYPEGSHDLADWTTTGTLEILDIHGGETLTLYTMSANIADAEITGYEEAIVTNWGGVTCDDFESVKVYVDSIYGDLGYGSENDALLICVQDGDYRVKFDSTLVDDLDTEKTEGLSTWGAGETDVSKMVVTFKTNAKGTYTFTYRVVPEVEIPA